MRMRWIRCAAVLLAAVLSGCANFRTAADFGHETRQVAAAVTAELGELHRLCVQGAALKVAVDDIADDAPRHPLKRCESHRKSYGAFAAATAGTLDAYGKALLGLAEDRSFDLSEDVGAASVKLGALTAPDGSALVSDRQHAVITKVLTLIADVWARRQREEGIRRLVEVKPELEENALAMRSFFAAPANSSPARQPPYDQIVGIATDQFERLEASLKDPAFRKREPIRTRELLTEIRPLGQALRQRAADTAGVQTKVVAAIDAWLAALNAFEREALKPDAKATYEALKEVRQKVVALREALRD